MCNQLDGEMITALKHVDVEREIEDVATDLGGSKRTIDAWKAKLVFDCLGCRPFAASRELSGELAQRLTKIAFSS